jgi:hypothetical protein
MYIAERGGRVRVVKDGLLDDHDLLDIHDLVSTSASTGLESIAFPASFSSSRTFFIAYSDKNGDSLLASVKALDEETAEAEQITVLLKVIQPTPQHPPVRIRFGTDGYLYVAFADRRNTNPQNKSRQNSVLISQQNSLLGTVARLDVSDTKRYRIPSDSLPRQLRATTPEVWARAIGAPWAFFADPTKSRLLLGASPTATSLEITALEEGAQPSPGKALFTSTAGASESFVGGIVYRGAALAGLRGSIILAEKSTGTIFSASQNNATQTVSSPLAHAAAPIAAIGESAAGELYVATDGGDLLQVVLNSASTKPSY